MLLYIDQEIPGAIHGSVVEFLFGGELFHGIYRLCVLSIHLVLPRAFFGEGPSSLLTTGQGSLAICVGLFICGLE